MLEDIKKDAVTRMTKCVQTFQADTRKLRTGRAHPSLVEHLKVDYYGPETPLVAKRLKYLEGNIKPDGGVYSQGLATYTTCLAIVAFKESNTGGKYDKVIENASKYVRSLQYGEGIDAKDVRFGGAGYGQPGGKDRPDLSNTQFLVEALINAGVPKDDPAIQKALIFISRSQNS